MYLNRESPGTHFLWWAWKPISQFFSIVRLSCFPGRSITLQFTRKEQLYGLCWLTLLGGLPRQASVSIFCCVMFVSLACWIKFSVFAICFYILLCHVCVSSLLSKGFGLLVTFLLSHDLPVTHVSLALIKWFPVLCAEIVIVWIGSLPT